MATATNTTNPSSVDRAAVMRAAWNHYNTVTRVALFGRFDRGCFAASMRKAWADAKRVAAAAAIPAEEKAARIAGIQQSLGMLRYKSFRYDVASERKALEAELNALAA